MVRVLALSVALLLTAQAAPAFAQNINVTGQLSGGNFINAVCSVSNGKISGTGVLYGVNPSNGYTYKYPFAITNGTTASGKLVLTGSFVAVPGSVVYLSASVPSGPMAFTYIVNGKAYTLTGNGTVKVN